MDEAWVTKWGPVWANELVNESELTLAPELEIELEL